MRPEDKLRDMGNPMQKGSAFSSQWSIVDPSQIKNYKTVVLSGVVGSEIDPNSGTFFLDRTLTSSQVSQGDSMQRGDCCTSSLSSQKVQNVKVSYFSQNPFFSQTVIKQSSPFNTKEMRKKFEESKNFKCKGAITKEDDGRKKPRNRSVFPSLLTPHAFSPKQDSNVLITSVVNEQNPLNNSVRQGQFASETSSVREENNNSETIEISEQSQNDTLLKPYNDCDGGSFSFNKGTWDELTRQTESGKELSLDELKKMVDLILNQNEKYTAEAAYFSSTELTGDELKALDTLDALDTKEKIIEYYKPNRIKVPLPPQSYSSYGLDQRGWPSVCNIRHNHLHY